MNKSSNKKKTKSEKSSMRVIFKIFLILIFTLLAFFLFTMANRLYIFKKADAPKPLTEVQQEIFEYEMNKNYPDRNIILKELPYATKKAELEIAAESCIVVDVASSSILYEKNADMEIPPASITKIAVMYVVLQEIEKGSISYSDTVYLPPECWACNMPAHSSLMFLGKGQIVTVEELLQGLDICSGNDAAYALAFHLGGSIDDFVNRMNDLVHSLGLTHTHFVDPSGYSEHNVTTARELATLCKMYLERFPESLQKFHSLSFFTYPKEHNLALEDRGKPRVQDFSNGLPENITMGITQQNTNVLLGRLSGVDGLKTGYIQESGYNLALTAKRNGTRFLSITMKGPGNNIQEGNRFRAKDGTTIMEWAFQTFATCARDEAVHRYFVPVTGAKEQWVYLSPAENFTALTVPFITGKSPEDAVSMVRVLVNLPKFIEGGTVAATEYGSIEYVLNDVILQKIPLVADRHILKANPFVSATDFVARLILKNRE